MSYRLTRLSRAIRLGYGDRARQALLTVNQDGQVENLLVLGHGDAILHPGHTLLMTIIPDFMTAGGLASADAYYKALRQPRIAAQLSRFMCAARSDHPLSCELQSIRHHPLRHGEYTWYSLTHHDDSCTEYAVTLTQTQHAHCPVSKGTRGNVRIQQECSHRVAVKERR